MYGIVGYVHLHRPAPANLFSHPGYVHFPFSARCLDVFPNSSSLYDTAVSFFGDGILRLAIVPCRQPLQRPRLPPSQRGAGMGQITRSVARRLCTIDEGEFD